MAEAREGAVILGIRLQEQRRRTGVVPGALCCPRKPAANGGGSTGRHGTVSKWFAIGGSGPRNLRPPLGFRSVGGARLTLSTRAPWSVDLVAAYVFRLVRHTLTTDEPSTHGNYRAQHLGRYVGDPPARLFRW